MSAFVKPFRMGDVVKLKPKAVRWPWKADDMVIHETTMGQGEYEYSTNQGAWFNHSDLVFVRECDALSIKVLQTMHSEED
jgi:hypothetical protein